MAARAEATPEDFSGSLVWQSAIGVTHAGGPTRETEFEVLDDPPGLIASTRGRNGGGHVLAVTTNPAPGSPVARTPQQARDVIGGRLEPGDPATVDRLAAIVSARTKVPSPEVARRALRAGAGRPATTSCCGGTARRGTPPGTPPTCASTATPTTSTRCASPSTT